MRPRSLNLQSDAGYGGERREVACADRTLALDGIADALSLSQTNRCLDVRQSEVEPELLVQEPPPWKEGQVPEVAQSVGEGFVVGDDHATFAAGDELVGIEAEAAEVAETAAASPL
jgi:hypothetical protein